MRGLLDPHGDFEGTRYVIRGAERKNHEDRIAVDD
jgi:hypothetical protein